MCSDIGRKAAGLIAVAVFVSLCATSVRAHNASVVEGIVKNSSGQPVAGAFVKLKNAEKRLTFMVISQAQGRYTADRLPAGKYSVQGVGGGFQSDWSAPVTVADGGTAKHDISLTKTQAAALPGAWPGRIPEEAGGTTWPEGAGKQLAMTKCVACHEAGRTLTRRTTREGWHETAGNAREHERHRHARPDGAGSQHTHRLPGSKFPAHASAGREQPSAADAPDRRCPELPRGAV
jgi:mono/diheme cytochrome c family protein